MHLHRGSEPDYNLIGSKRNTSRYAFTPTLFSSNIEGVFLKWTAHLLPRSSNVKSMSSRQLMRVILSTSYDFEDFALKLMPRISLLNLFFIITMVALVVVVYRQASELRALKPRVKQLDEERGTLVVADPRLVHAIQVPSRFATNDGTYRVFIPKDKTYVAIVAVNDIPQTGFPDVARHDSRNMLLGQAGRNAFARLEPGEHQVSLHVQERDGKAYVRFAIDGLDMLVNMPPGTWPEVCPLPYAVFGSDSIGNATTTVECGQPLVLQRHRIAAAPTEFTSFTAPNPPGPVQGMMLWIEPIEAPKTP